MKGVHSEDSFKNIYSQDHLKSVLTFPDDDVSLPDRIRNKISFPPFSQREIKSLNTIKVTSTRAIEIEIQTKE